MHPDRCICIGINIAGGVRRDAAVSMHLDGRAVDLDGDFAEAVSQRNLFHISASSINNKLLAILFGRGATAVFEFRKLIEFDGNHDLAFDVDTADFAIFDNA